MQQDENEVLKAAAERAEIKQVLGTYEIMQQVFEQMFKTVESPRDRK